MSHDAVLKRLLKLHPRRIDFSLDRVRALLKRLGDPQTRLAPVVHVAGTNGKGSTIALLAGILRAAGYRVQIYSSPHLVHFNERIELADGPISDDLVGEILDECEHVNAGDPITFFEITTAAAFLAFARYEADITLVEVGLGGRLDATNVVTPRICAITPVSRDHEDFLGSDLAGIAGEKAAILKPGVPAVIGRQDPMVLDVIESSASAIDAPLSIFDRDFCAEVTDKDGKIRYRDDSVTFSLPEPALPGRHQIHNAGMAIRLARLLDEFNIGEKAILKGLSAAHWPARLQRVERDWPTPLPEGTKIWLDGGHNEAAAQALAEYFTERGPIHLVCGMLSTKNSSAFLTRLKKCTQKLYAVPIFESTYGLPPAELCDIARCAGIKAQPFSDVGQAVEAIVKTAGPRPRILIAGSLYLAGSVLRLIEANKKGTGKGASFPVLMPGI